MTEIIVDNGVSESGLTELDLTRFSQLKRLIVGDHCFAYVNELKLIGMNELESVVIGESSFTRETSCEDLNRHFYLKNCPSLKVLWIGPYSFSDYSVCEIENVDALELIRMSDWDDESSSFKYASALKLRSILFHCK